MIDHGAPAQPRSAFPLTTAQPPHTIRPHKPCPMHIYRGRGAWRVVACLLLPKMMKNQSAGTGQQVSGAVAALALHQGVPGLGFGFWCSTAAVVFDAWMVQGLCVVLWTLGVPGCSCWSRVMVAGFPCFPCSLAHPT